MVMAAVDEGAVVIILESLISMPVALLPNDLAPAVAAVYIQVNAYDAPPAMDEAVRGDGAENKVTAPVPGIDMAEGETFIAAASPVLVTVIMTVMNSPSETVSDEAD